MEPANVQHCNPMRVESNWQNKVLDKKFLIAISKSDMLDDELMNAIEKELPEKIPHIFISSFTNKGLIELKDNLWKALN